jgi:hypothetical protein
MTHQTHFEKWWHDEGSQAPYTYHDCEEHTKRMCEIAWANGAYKEREHYDDLFAHIKGWCEAYPIAVFPEPDFKKAHEALKANGMTLDAISASNMKHVITQVQKMIDAAIRARGEA